MQKRGSRWGFSLAVVLPALFFLTTSPAFAAPVRALAEVQVIPLAGMPTAAIGKFPARALGENQTLPAGGWVQTGSMDRALVWLVGQPGCQFVLEPDGRVRIGTKRVSTVGLYTYTTKLERGTLRSPRADCGATFEVTTPVARLVSEGAQFSVKVTDGWISVFHQKGNLQLLFHGQAIPLRAMTVTTISSSGSHRIASFSEEENKTVSTAAPSPERATREALPAVNNISPVSATGRP